MVHHIAGQLILPCEEREDVGFGIRRACARAVRAVAAVLRALALAPRQHTHRHTWCGEPRGVRALVTGWLRMGPGKRRTWWQSGRAQLRHRELLCVAGMMVWQRGTAAACQRACSAGNLPELAGDAGLDRLRRAARGEANQSPHRTPAMKVASRKMRPIRISCRRDEAGWLRCSTLVVADVGAWVVGVGVGVVVAVVVAGVVATATGTAAAVAAAAVATVAAFVVALVAAGVVVAFVITAWVGDAGVGVTAVAVVRMGAMLVVAVVGGDAGAAVAVQYSLAQLSLVTAGEDVHG